VVAADTLISANKVAQPTALGGITYKVLLTLVESVISENPELYASIQMNLPGVAEIEALFQEKVAEWAEMVNAEKPTGKRQSRIRQGLREYVPARLGVIILISLRMSRK